jgi:hypothetical protein
MNAETQFSPTVPKLAMKSLIKKYNFDKAPLWKRRVKGDLKEICYVTTRVLKRGI